MCSAAPSSNFKVRFQGIVGMDGPVAGLHGSRLTRLRHRLSTRPVVPEPNTRPFQCASFEYVPMPCPEP